MRKIDILALLLVAVVAIGGKLFAGGGEGAAPDERRPDPRGFAPGHAVPAPALPDEPTIVVTIEERKQNSTGTAFSVDRSGIWITARHVTDGCDTVALQPRDGRPVRARRVDAHGFADISVLWTRGGAPAMALARPRPREGQDGYSFGFPKGLPGDVKAKLDTALEAAIGSGPVQTFIERRKLAGNYQGSEALTAEVRAEAAAWAKVKAGLKK